MSAKKPFLSTEYTRRTDDHGDEREDPIVDLEIIANGLAHPIHAYADTGTDDALSISMKFAEDIGLKRYSDEPTEITLADGSRRGAYPYAATIKIGDKTSDLLIFVIDPTLRYKKSRTTLANEPLLGRGIIDDYNVLFQGKSTPKKIHFED